MAKCMKLGWYLPYSPADNEYGAWKRHYINCIETLDMNIPSQQAVSIIAASHKKVPNILSRCHTCPSFLWYDTKF